MIGALFPTEVIREIRAEGYRYDGSRSGWFVAKRAIWTCEEKASA